MTPDVCPICVPLAAAQGQRSPEVTRLWQEALAVPCRCLDGPHTPLVRHPHTRPGCAGYTPLVATEDSPMSAPTPPTCGAQYKALVDRLFPPDWLPDHDGWHQVFLECPEDPPGFALFSLGSMQGEASKVALGACAAFMVRPAPDWWDWSQQAMQLICDHYGLLLHADPRQGEIWGVRPEWLGPLEHALSQPVNGPDWHRERGMLCGIRPSEIDLHYHTRDTYGVRCEPERREA
jgi:hypothetical protein